LEFWYRRKFNLAPTDPRFLEVTEEEMHIEHWAWVYHENPNYQGDEDSDFDKDKILKEMEDAENWVPA
jgi:hypothetical protein